MLDGSHQKAVTVDFEQAMEDDGVLALTFWFVGNGRPYLSICCTETPGNIYIESEDQIHGFETKGLSFQFYSDSLLVLELLNGTFFPATTISRLEIDIPPEVEIPLRKRLGMMMPKSP